MDAESDLWADAKLRKDPATSSLPPLIVSRPSTREKSCEQILNLNTENNRPRSRWAWPSVSLSKCAV
jgi:hypothetical protein